MSPMTKTRVIGLLTVILLITAGASIYTVRDATSTPHDLVTERQLGTGDVSTLSHPRRPLDALPARLETEAFAPMVSDIQGARLARTVGSDRIYLIPGKRGTICLVIADSAGRSRGSCGDRKLLLSKSIFVAEPQADETVNVIGLVSDGHTAAESEGVSDDVTNNVFVLKGTRERVVTLHYGDEEHQFDLGLQTPQP